MDCLKQPHYLLISESSQLPGPGHWRFVLRAAEGDERIVADDIDPEARGDRLELLTVVRGLEALQQPSRVTLWTPSTYVREGIRHGLREWRENGWLWEYFGRLVPVKNEDLWRRLDRAMEFHHVDCRTWRIDAAHGPQPAQPRYRETSKTGETGNPPLDATRVAQIREKLGRWRTSIIRCFMSILGAARLAENP